MNKILTLAVPAYNMEKYLGRCLDSILLPEVEADIEVLLINDGSKDDTLSIAREYEKLHAQALRVIDKPNGGWGSAINLAMQEASGKYFKILDSDDWFNSESFLEYVELLKRVDTDMVISAYTYAYIEGGSKEVYFPEEQCGQIVDFTLYLEKNGYQHGMNLSNATFRTALLQNKRLKVADRYYADIEYVMKPLADVRTIYFANMNLYQYYIGREGQSTSVAGYNAHLDDFVTMLKKLVVYYEQVQKSVSDAIRKMYHQDFGRLVTFSYYLHMSPTYAGQKSDSPSKLKELDKYIKQQSRQLYKISGGAKIKGSIPYIAIWRLTGINILKLRTWI